MTAAPLSELLRRGLGAGHDVILIAADGRPVLRAAFRAQVAAARRALRAHGDPRGRRVALHGAITPPLVAGLVAALLDGAVVVPLDADLPDLRKAMMVELAQAGLVLDFHGDAAGFAPRSTVVDATGAGGFSAPGGAPDDIADPAGPALEPSAPCYIFFTSGTTGAPKGVLGRRGGLAHFLAWEVGLLDLAPGERVSILTRLSFDVVLRDLLAPIVGRATGCIAPRGVAPGAMLDWLDQRSVTVTHVVPSLARSFLSAMRPGFVGGALRHALFAGEPLTASLVRRWRAAFPLAAIYNLYGPTETTLAKFCARIVPPGPASADAIPTGGALDEHVLPCGHPLPETEAIIIATAGGDPQGRAPVPPGTLGEVAIATPHRSLGYLDDAQTRERFVRIADREVYLTGDLGFVAPDGQLHLRGRRDDQVKVLGVRVELAGVAAAIQSFDGVSDAAVICVDDGDDKRLIAYFTAAAGGDAVARALRPYLAERLPPAAIPSCFVELPAMPLTPSGKLDRARLPAPPRAAAVPVADAVEQAVVDAFAAQLAHPGVGPLDDFFALGGDSLAAAGLCAAIERRLGAYLAPAELLSAATPRALADRVRAAAPPAAIPRAPADRSFSLSPQQRRYFRTFCAGGNRSWCNMVALIALPDGTTRAAVEDALADIAARHDSLRLAFGFDDDGVLRQSIDVSWHPPVTDVDLAELAPGDAHRAVARLRIAEADRPIPILAHGPLFRARLLRLPGDRRTLLWTVHHLISDGTSQGILARELAGVLAGRRTGEAERFAAPSFKDVAAWAAHRPGLDAARSHFRALFAAPYRHPYLPLQIAVDDPQRATAIERAVPAAVRARAHELARAHRTTPYAIWLAAVFRMWSRRTGATDLTVLTPLAGRDHPQVAPLIGDFINLVPLRIADLAAGSGAVIRAVKQQVQGAARHQALQFDELLDELGVPFDPDRNPLSGLSLNFMPQSGAMPPQAPGAADRGYKLKYDVLVLMRDYEDGTAVEIQYRAGLLAAAGAAALFDELCAAMEGLSS
jgi:non-ribosomal peptide synthetase component F/acyl carrier protein